jgi:hypothetical protein
MKPRSFTNIILFHLLFTILLISCTKKEVDQTTTDKTEDVDSPQMLSCFVATLENYQTKA